MPLSEEPGRATVVSMGTLKPLSGVIKLTLSIETPVIHVQGGFKVPMETGRNLEHTTERHQRGFKVPMETGSMFRRRWLGGGEGECYDIGHCTSTIIFLTY